MKKPIITALLAMGALCSAWAAPVTPQRAGNVALSYVAQQTNAADGVSVKSVSQINDGIYLVQFAPMGFAMVSADDNANPILAYSLESNLDANRMPQNMAFIVKEAGDVVSLQAKRGTLNRTWKTIETGALARSRASGEPVDPLIRVNWNQSQPYNKYCPGDGAKKAVVGCVAVAMSQAMSVQQYPLRPQGQAKYVAPGYGQLSIDYDKEPNYDWNAIVTGANGFDDVAKLLYHAGMSVEMGYGADGSGIPSSQVYRISNALKNIFAYGSEVTYTWRKDYRGTWSDLLLNELYAGRAVIYNATDSKGGYGHSFNIDGYNGALYHVNWGWGGYGNGYFSIDALADAQMSMNYDSNHVAVTGIGAANSVLKGINMLDTSVEADQPAGTPVSAVLVNGELPTSDMTISLTGEYTSNGYKTVPFKYSNGQIVTTEPISLDKSPIYLRIVVSMKSDPTVKITQGYNVEVEAPQSIEHKTSIEYNRATKTFKVHTKYNASYTLKNAQGAQVMSGTVSTLPEFEFSRDQLSAGTNVLQITVGGKSYSVNIVK